MKKRSVAANVITAILATLLSLVLVVVLFATGLVGGARAAVTPKVMENMINETIQSFDFEELIINSAEDNNISAEDLKQAQMISKLMNSDAAQEFFGLYAKDMAAALSGTYSTETAAVNKQAVQDLLDTHLDDLVTILGDVSDADREQIREELLNYVDENLDTVLGDMAIENIVQDSSMTDMVEVINVLPTVLTVLIVVCIVLALLIYACRCYRFGGFIWVGVDTAIVAVLTLGISRLLKSGALVALLGEFEVADILMAVFGAVGSVFGKVALILFGIAVLCIGLYILLKYTVLKKRDAAANEPVFTVGDVAVAEEAPVAEELPAAEETL